MAVNVVPGTQDSFSKRILSGSSSNTSGFPSQTGSPGRPGYSMPGSRKPRAEVGVMYISATGSELKCWLPPDTVPVAIRMRMPS